LTTHILILVVQSVVSACTNCGVRTERVEVCQQCLKLAKCKICFRRHLAPHCFHTKDICHACHRKMTKTRVRHAVNEVVNETSIPTSSGDMSFDQFIEDNANYIRQIVDTYRQRFGCMCVCYFVFTHNKLLCVCVRKCFCMLIFASLSLLNKKCANLFADRYEYKSGRPHPSLAKLKGTSNTSSATFKRRPNL